MTTMGPAVARKKRPDPRYAAYQSTKIDRDVYKLAKLAAAKIGLEQDRYTIQEFISDAINREAARIAGVPPVARKPAPPRRPGSGRPRPDED